jgi:hypothetical protein
MSPSPKYQVITPTVSVLRNGTVKVKYVSEEGVTTVTTKPNGDVKKSYSPYKNDGTAWKTTSYGAKTPISSSSSVPRVARGGSKKK